MTLLARVALVKRVPPGQGVSYGHTYTSPTRDTLAGLVPLGYADGSRGTPAAPGRCSSAGGGSRSPGGSAWTRSCSTSAPGTPAGRGRRGRRVRRGRDGGAHRDRTGRTPPARSPTRSSPGSAAASRASTRARRAYRRRDGREGPVSAPGPRVGLVSLGVGLAAAGVGAALGLAAERVTVGRPLRPPSTSRPPTRRRGLRHDPRARASGRGRRRHRCCTSRSTSWTRHRRPRPPRDGRRRTRPAGAARVTVVFSHGYALSLDSWHFQRKAPARPVPAGVLGPAGSRPVRRPGRRARRRSTRSARDLAASSPPRPPRGRWSSSVTRWAA